jgi:phosphoribosyl 1,2-cyclic phosphodiesterase
MKKIEVIGCGSAFAPELGNSSFIIWNEPKRGILFDCGGDVFAKLKAGNCLPFIDTVIISHFHLDHAGSLDTLIYWNWFVLKRKLKLINFYPYYFLNAIDSSLLDMVEISSGSNDEDINIFKVNHCIGMASHGAQIGNIFISGDTNHWVGITDESICLHEVCFGAKYPNMVHCHFDDLCLAIPFEERIKYWLYHYNVGDVEKYEHDVLISGFAGLLKQGDIIDVS